MPVSACPGALLGGCTLHRRKPGIALNGGYVEEQCCRIATIVYFDKTGMSLHREFAVKSSNSMQEWSPCFLDSFRCKTQKAIEYDEEMPQSQNKGEPDAPRGRDTRPQRNTNGS